jgi:hypothetical protein
MSSITYTLSYLELRSKNNTRKVGDPMEFRMIPHGPDGEVLPREIRDQLYSSWVVTLNGRAVQFTRLPRGNRGTDHFIVTEQLGRGRVRAIGKARFDSTHQWVMVCGEWDVPGKGGKADCE